MQIILQKNVSNIGLVGDVVNVKPGYYRNFLAPRKLALLANPKSIKQLEHTKRVIEIKKIKEKGLALTVKEKLEKENIQLAHSAGAGDKLFGSVTSQEIIGVLKGRGFEIDRKYLKLDSPIKTIGVHMVPVKLHPEVVCEIKVEVVRK